MNTSGTDIRSDLLRVLGGNEPNDAKISWLVKRFARAADAEKEEIFAIVAIELLTEMAVSRNALNLRKLEAAQ